MSAPWIAVAFMLGTLIGLSVGIVRGSHAARVDNTADFEQIAAEWDQIVTERQDMQATYRAMAAEAATGDTASKTEGRD